MKHAVVAGILVRPTSTGGRVLLCRRRADLAWYPQCWDLPGGHVEDDETLLEALGRELREELGITVVGARVAATISEPQLELTVFRVDAWRGEPANLAPEEHEHVRWFRAADVPDLELADDRALPLLLHHLGRD